MALHPANGLYLRAGSEIDCEVRRACLAFCQWLRKNYEFPVRLTVYLKPTKKILARNREWVYDTLWMPGEDDIRDPYIKIATGEYPMLVEKEGKDNALCAILNAIATMVGSYYLWIDEEIDALSDDEAVAWAQQFADAALDEYAQTRTHP